MALALVLQHEQGEISIIQGAQVVEAIAEYCGPTNQEQVPFQWDPGNAVASVVEQAHAYAREVTWEAFVVASAETASCGGMAYAEVASEVAELAVLGEGGCRQIDPLAHDGELEKPALKGRIPRTHPTAPQQAQSTLAMFDQQLAHTGAVELLQKSVQLAFPPDRWMMQGNHPARPGQASGHAIECRRCHVAQCHVCELAQHRHQAANQRTCKALVATRHSRLQAGADLGPQHPLAVLIEELLGPSRLRVEASSLRSEAQCPRAAALENHEGVQPCQRCSLAISLGEMRAVGHCSEPEVRLQTLVRLWTQSAPGWADCVHLCLGCALQGHQSNLQGR